MPSTKFFLSYPRTAADEVGALADHLARLGQDVWLDQELSGGQSWWDTILERIRTCDCFMFTVCEAALQSKACRAELEYAHEAQRIILPMAIGPAVPDQLLPRYLSQLQRVSADDPTQVARALLHLPEPGPLPSPLPPPPPVPISYLDELAEVVERPSLSLADQNNLLATLRQRVAHGEDREAALTLLRRLRRRSDVYAGVAEDVDTELARHQDDAKVDHGIKRPTASTGASPPAGPPIPSTPSGSGGSGAPPPSSPTPPPPAPPPRSRRKGLVAAIAAGVLVVGGVGTAVSLGGGGGSEPDPPPDTSNETSPPTDPPDDEPWSYGDDPYLDELDDSCASGSLADCDQLFAESPSGSDYEGYGATCGDISVLVMNGQCDDQFSTDFDAGARACDGGDLAACDALYIASPAGSPYEEFGSYCGHYSDEPLTGSCEATL